MASMLDGPKYRGLSGDGICKTRKQEQCEYVRKSTVIRNPHPHAKPQSPLFLSTSRAATPSPRYCLSMCRTDGEHPRLSRSSPLWWMSPPAATSWASVLGQVPLCAWAGTTWERQPGILRLPAIVGELVDRPMAFARVKPDRLGGPDRLPEISSPMRDTVLG
jgi:hypothetical protein